MKESAKLARIKVAFEGLTFLLEGKQPIRRSELFRVSEKDEKNVEMLKTATTGAWRKAYVQRLVDRGVLVKSRDGSQERYQAADSSVVRKILEDHKNDGLILSRFLFPKEVGPPPSFLPDVREEVEDEEGSELEEVTEEEQSEVLEVLIKSLVDVRDRLISLESKVEKAMTMRAEVIETRKMVIQLDKEIREVVQSFPTVARCQEIIRESVIGTKLQEEISKTFGPIHARVEHTVAAAELAVSSCKRLAAEVDKLSKSRTASIVQDLKVLTEMLVDAVGEDTDESKT